MSARTPLVSRKRDASPDLEGLAGRKPAATRGSGAGFTTLELLMASALIMVVTGAIAALVQPLNDAVERSLARSDLTGGARTVLDRLAADIREAGSPAAAAIDRVRLARVVPAVSALADLDSGISASPGQALRILRVPHLARQGLLMDAVATGTVYVPLAASPACSAVGPACGFLAGMLAVLHDEAAAVFVTVHSVSDAGVVRLTSPINQGFDAGAVLAEAVVTTYGLRPDPDGSARLVRVQQGVDQPIIQQVIGFGVETVGGDPLRVRAVILRLRLEAAAHLRGPQGALFRRAGTSRRARSWVPDVEWTTLVAVRQGES